MKKNSMDLKMERLSKANTVLARLRNLLEERSIEIPPNLERDIDDQLDSYKGRMEIELEQARGEKEEEQERVEQTFKQIRNRRGDLPEEVKQVFSETINEIEREKQKLDGLNPEDLLANPDWI